MNLFTKSLLTTTAIAALYAGACTTLSAANADSVKPDSSIDEKFSNIPIVERIVFVVNTGKHNYKCLTDAQGDIEGSHGRAYCLKIGLERDAEKNPKKYYVKDVFQNFKDNYIVLWDKKEETGEYSSESFRRFGKENPKLSYGERVKKLGETRIEEEVYEEIKKYLNMGCTVICVAWNPYSVVKKDLVTHIFIAKGINKKGDVMIKHDFGGTKEIISLEELYSKYKITGGIDALVVLPPPKYKNMSIDTFLNAFDAERINESTKSITPITNL